MVHPVTEMRDCPVGLVDEPYSDLTARSVARTDGMRSGPPHLRIKPAGSRGLDPDVSGLPAARHSAPQLWWHNIQDAGAVASPTDHGPSRFQGGYVVSVDPQLGYVGEPRRNRSLISWTPR